MFQFSESGHAVDRLSGLVRSYKFISTSNEVTLRFVSDGNTRSKGFQLKYRGTNGLICKHFFLKLSL